MRAICAVALSIIALSATTAGAADPIGAPPSHGIRHAEPVPPARTEHGARIEAPLFPPEGFVYPLDDAGAFFPPHPASGPHGAPVYRFVERRTIAQQSHVLPSGIPFAHAEWCHTRYASYRAADNTFLPPRGARRTCVSPHR